MIAAVLGAAVVYLVLLAVRLAGVYRSRRTLGADPAADTASVTVLVPILSGDPRLEQTLESNLNALPRVRFLWLVDAADQPALELAAALKARYPGRAVWVEVFEPAPPGINPKTYKLDRALALVTTEFFLVLDDDTEILEPSLTRLLADLGSGDLVTVLPSSRPQGGLWSRLLAHFVADQSALTYLGLGAWMPTVTINGMGYAARTASMRSWGGFTPVLRHLTDDLAVATLVRQAGGRLVQSTAPVKVGTTVSSGRRYFRQMHRWFLFGLLLTRRQTPSTVAVLLTFLAAPPALLLAAVALTACGLTVWTALALTVLLLVRAAALGSVGAEKLTPLGAVLSVVSELLQPVHLLHALFVRTITWRSRRYRVVENDEFYPI